MFEKRGQKKKVEKLGNVLEEKNAEYKEKYATICSLASTDKVAAYRMGSKLFTDLKKSSQEFIDAVVRSHADFEKLYAEWQFNDEGEKSFYSYVRKKKPTTYFVISSGAVGAVSAPIGVLLFIVGGLAAALTGSSTVAMSTLIPAGVWVTGGSIGMEVSGEARIPIINRKIGEQYHKFHTAESAMSYLKCMLDSIKVFFCDAVKRSSSEEDKSYYARQLKEIEQIEEETKKSLEGCENPNAYKEEDNNEL